MRDPRASKVPRLRFGLALLIKHINRLTFARDDRWGKINYCRAQHLTFARDDDSLSIIRQMKALPKILTLFQSICGSVADPHEA
jgi:hypothetical protein